ncbi:MAG: hypothetical protein H0W93_06385 [Gammaproteobacteria bacterium]|nr:hypothetical protein [Gammaproteobacteria bacterium]
MTKNERKSQNKARERCNDFCDIDCHGNCDMRLHGVSAIQVQPQQACAAAMSSWPCFGGYWYCR